MHLLLKITCLLLAFASPAFADLKIVTTTTDYADFAKQIGKEKVTVHSVMKGPENVHNVLATPAEMMKLNQADMFVHSGLDTEPWRDNFLKGARNSKVAPGKPGNVDMSTSIELLEIPDAKADRSKGDIHAYGNPHCWLSPANAQRMVATLVKAMMDVDPANAEFYKENAIALVKDLGELHKTLKEEVARAGDLQVMTFHSGWPYFLKALGIQSAGTIEANVGITPSPAEIKAAIDAGKKANVRVVIVETYNSLREARQVADAIGAKVVVLPDHVHGVEGVDSYQKLMKYNVAKILEAAGVPATRPAETAPAK
jgi:zinc/manganese transport system substrate-binding protein